MPKNAKSSAIETKLSFAADPFKSRHDDRKVTLKVKQQIYDKQEALIFYFYDMSIIDEKESEQSIKDVEQEESSESIENQ